MLPFTASEYFDAFSTEDHATDTLESVSPVLVTYSFTSLILPFPSEETADPLELVSETS